MMASTSTMSCYYPSDYYYLMERQREKLCPNTLRQDYVHIFIIETLESQLLLPSQGSKKNFTTSIDAGSKESDTVCENNCNKKEADVSKHNEDEETVLFMIGNKEVKSFIKRLLTFSCLVKKTPGIGFNSQKAMLLFCDRITCPSLELIWLITCSKYKIFGFNSYIMEVALSSKFQSFVNQLMIFCFSSCLFEDNKKRKGTKMLQDFLPEILIGAFCNPEINDRLKLLKKISHEILTKITYRLISKNPIMCSFMTRQLLLAVIQGVPLANSIKRKYFSLQLELILSRHSDLTHKDILRQQEKFAGPVEIENSAMCDTISLFISEPPQEVLELLEKHLRNPEVNWESLLLVITLWAKNESNASSSTLFSLLKETIRGLMTTGLNEKKEADILAAFILARHCCLISPQNFARYEKWYVTVFGNETTSLATTPETFTFLATVLTSWIPNEPVCFLQVHATYWPHIPTGMRNIWSDYVNLSKVRISEYNEVEEAMEYEPNPNNPIQYHIEMILKSFDSLKKIPEGISEMLMFRKKYYHEQFLPALLRKPHGIALSDGRLRLIEALNTAGKLPSNLYKVYKENLK